MKILYLTANGGLWGDNRSLLALLEELTDIKPIVIVGADGPFINELAKRKISFKIIPNYHNVWPNIKNFRDGLLFLPRLCRTLFYNKIAYYKILKIVKDFNPNLIHTNIGTVHIGYHIAKKCKIKHVWHIREFQTLDFNMKPFPSFSLFINKVHDYKHNYIIAISKTIYNFLGNPSNGKIIYNGIVNEIDKPFIKPNKEKYFTFIGRISLAKGIDEIINSFLEFCKYDFNYTLYIVGTGNLRLENQLKKQIKSAQMEKRVIFVGFKKDINDIIQNAKAIIVSSHNEAFGRVTVEAMANGCPVIGKATAGTAEILKNGEYGFLYNTQEELVNIMLKIANTPDSELLPLLTKAQNYVFENYTKQKYANEVKKVYLQILNTDI